MLEGIKDDGNKMCRSGNYWNWNWSWNTGSAAEKKLAGTELQQSLSRGRAGHCLFGVKGVSLSLSLSISRSRTQVEINKCASKCNSKP